MMWKDCQIDCPGDVTRIADLISEVWSTTGAESEMHVGDLYWAIFSHAQKSSRPECFLWESNSALDAFAMLSARGWCDCVIAPSVFGNELLLELLVHVEAIGTHRQNVSRLRFGRRVEDGWLADLLKKHGYSRMQFGFPTLEIDLESLPQSTPVPCGFDIIATTDFNELTGNRANAWNSAFPNDPRDAADVEAVMKCAVDAEAVDLNLVTTDGTVAAFCTVWLDKKTVAVCLSLLVAARNSGGGD